MSFIIGRGDEEDEDAPSGTLGAYRALDGSSGAPLHLDMDSPHAMLVVGKRGYGKSYTLGVVAEGLAREEPVAPVVIDPMGVFTTLAESTGESISAAVIDSPAVTPDSLDPRSWCALVGLSPESGAGGLVWQAAQNASTIDGMRENIRETDAPGPDKRAATNHINLADEWGVFDAEGLDATALGSSEITVLDVSGMDSAPMNAVARGVGEALYRARVDDEIARLPWLLIDEAHTFFDGVADRTLRLILTRGRAPGVSLVLATQRPSAVPEVGISQADVLLSHRLTSHKDLEALRDAQPTYMNSSLDERMPTETGEVIIIDDSTETVHAAQIRSRETPHGGDSPNASDVVLDNEDGNTDSATGD
jgi:DNA helicase HerA-like ATPase